MQRNAALTAFLVLRGVSLPRATAFDPLGAGLAIACFLSSSCGFDKVNKSMQLFGRLHPFSLSYREDLHS